MRGPGWRGLAGLDLRLATAVASAAKASFSKASASSATSRAIRRAVLVGGTAPSPAAAIDTFEIARALAEAEAPPERFRLRRRLLQQALAKLRDRVGAGAFTAEASAAWTRAEAA
jgi:hypothetical protein